MNVYPCSSCGWSFDHEIHTASGVQACPHCGWKDELTVATNTALPTPQSETPETDELAHKQWGTWPKPGEIEAFDLAHSLERRLLEALAKQDAMQRRAESAEADWQAAEHRLAERGREEK